MPLLNETYVDQDGYFCPNCGEDPGLGYDDPIEESATVVTRKAECLHCGASWVEVYNLMSYDSLTLADGTEVQTKFMEEESND